MNNLYLIFPQWQGSGRSQELYYGAKILQSELDQDYSFVEVDVSLKRDLEIDKNILGYKEIKRHLKSATSIINRQKPEKIFSIGGDCGIELAPVSYLNQRLNGKLGVVWLDAHGDLNTPSSSPSKEFHGMPLRTILGEGDEFLRELLFSELNPDQVFLIGVRDLDSSELDFINNNNIELLPIEEIAERENLITEIISSRGFESIYIHVDLDVLDPIHFPSVKCPVPKGLIVERLLELIEELNNNFSVVGGSIVEYSPKGGENKEKESVRALIEKLFDQGKSINLNNQ